MARGNNRIMKLIFFLLLILISGFFIFRWAFRLGENSLLRAKIAWSPKKLPIKKSKGKKESGLLEIIGIQSKEYLEEESNDK